MRLSGQLGVNVYRCALAARVDRGPLWPESRRGFNGVTASDEGNPNACGTKPIDATPAHTDFIKIETE